MCESGARMLSYALVICPVRRPRATRNGVSAPLSCLEFGRQQPSLPVGEEESATDVSQGVAGVADPGRTLSLPDGNSSVTELLGLALPASAASATLGTVRTYEAVLRSMLPEVSTSFGVSALPMTSEPAFYGFFRVSRWLDPAARPWLRPSRRFVDVCKTSYGGGGAWASVARLAGSV